MSLFDTRVPAVLLRTDRNPFHHGTLGAVRSLGRAGVTVHVVADCADSPVGASRYVHRLHTPPPPGASPAEIAAVLRRVAARIARPAVLIPMDDACAVAVGRARAELAPAYLLPGLSAALPERVADKAELAGVCASLGVPHPRTLLPDGPAEAEAAARRLGLPVVAKWSRPWLLPAGSGLRSTVLVREARQARELSRRAEEAGSRLLLQEFLPPGPGRDWFFHGYADRSGVLRAGGTGRKTRSRPRGAGLTAVGRWVPNTEVRALAERVAGELGTAASSTWTSAAAGRRAATTCWTSTRVRGAVPALRRHRRDGRRTGVAPGPDTSPRAGGRGGAGAGVRGGELRAAQCGAAGAGGRELAWHAADDRGPAGRCGAVGPACGRAAGQRVRRRAVAGARHRWRGCPGRRRRRADGAAGRRAGGQLLSPSPRGRSTGARRRG